jgi:hypothetical protein
MLLKRSIASIRCDPSDREPELAFLICADSETGCTFYFSIKMTVTFCYQLQFQYRADRQILQEKRPSFAMCSFKSDGTASGS